MSGVRYGPEHRTEVLRRLASGRALKSVGRDPDMPSASMVLRWGHADPVFGAQLKAIRPRSGSPGGGRKPCLYSEALARGICDALAQGFSLTDICASPAVPVTPHGVRHWARQRPDFAARYADAIRPRPTPRGLRIGKGRWGAYAPERAQAIIDRLLKGRALRDIVRDPDTPTLSTITQWRRKHLDFHLAYNEARRFQMDLLLDDILDAANAGRKPGYTGRVIGGLARWGVLPYAAGREDGGALDDGAPGIGHNSGAAGLGVRF